MRDIKFRAWDGRSMQFGGFSIHATGKLEPCQGLSRLKGDSIIMQFIGLTDKNGVDIYEGDVMSPIHYQKIEFGNAVVEFNKGMFCFAVNKPFISSRKPLIESFGHAARANNHFIVIGNILQNPELLESKQ